MLRSPQIRNQVSQSFICWKCSAKLHSRSLYQARRAKHDASLSRLENRAFGRQSFGKRTARHVTVASIRNVSTEIFSNPSSDLPPPERPLPIRQRLEQWEIENASSVVLPHEPPKTLGEGDLLNTATRTSDPDYRIELEQNESDEDASLTEIGMDELLNVGNRRGFLLAGDLVELRGVMGQPQELAIYIRELESQSQFYTMSGKWIHRSSQAAQFFVPNFVDAEELEEILPFLPATPISQGLRDKLQEFPPHVARDLGKPLIRRMLDFWAESDASYQAASTSLDNAHELASFKYSMGYATLEEISKKVLPTKTSRTENGKFPGHVLYAVHRALLRNDIGFRPQAKGTLRTGGQYEISSRTEIANADLVCAMVRSHREHQAAIASGNEKSRSQRTLLQQFAEVARHLIDHSRRFRPFTAHGTIGPAEKGQEPADTLLREYRSAIKLNHCIKFVRFIESWAAFSTFGSRSPLNGIGSEILRATGRYEGDLDQTTAWTFLQEIGWISPWENRVSFDLRLGDYGKSPLLPSDSTKLVMLRDRLSKLRKDWGELPVYCIDDPGAHEIDDGISLEPTAVAGEFLIHIHTANPSSYIGPDVSSAVYAEFATENIYLPERIYSILNKEDVKASFSLEPDRPSMTFSARMNKDGHILDTKITPGRIHNVVFLSPAVMEEVVLGSTSANTHVKTRLVGSDSILRSPSRPMLESHELSHTQKTDLRLLHEIGAAHSALLRAKGGVDQNFPSTVRPSVSIPETRKEYDYSREPTIQFTTVHVNAGSNAPSPTQGNLVQSFMLVASQVAGMWCKERGIPVPYRITPRNSAKEDPAEFFRQKVLPSRAENGVASMDITSEYLRLIGGVLPSTTPGPHAAVGVDMMVRCTSPLRRFTDLLVHWQIGATLLEEHRLGQSLVSNTKDDFLPFSRARVDALLPRLDTREKLIKHGHREAERHWLCYYILRAWRFKEAELPPTFPFIVKDVDIEQRIAFGMLTDFTARAHCSVPDKMDIDEIEAGDRLEVELEDVNVYKRKIQVKALRRLESQRSV